MSTYFPTCYSILEGFGYSRALAQFKEMEDSARQGYNHAIAVISQLGQLYALFKQVNKLEAISGRTYIPSTLSALAYAAIPIIGAAHPILDWMEKPLPPVLKRNIKWLHDNIGTLSQIASVFTNVALLHLGCSAYAITSLTILTLGFLVRQKYLPLRVRGIYLKICPGIGTVGLLVTGSWILKPFAILELVSDLNHFIYTKKQIPYEEANHPSLLSYEQFNLLLEGNSSFHLELNRSHVHIAPFPVVKQLNFQPLLDLCNTCPWEHLDIFNQLETKLQQDVRWENSNECKEAQENSINERKLKIEYVKNNLKTLVYSIENECIETGEPLHYGVLKNYLAFIAERLPKAPQEQQIQLLLQLAIEGGDYCGPGVYYQLESVATVLLYGTTPSMDGDERPRLPLKQRILLILQQERLKIVSAFHLLIPKINPIAHSIYGGESDIHTLNRTINILASDFGLPDQGASHDLTAMIDCFSRYYWSNYIFRLRSEDLWDDTWYTRKGEETKAEQYQGYTIQRIYDSIYEQIGIPLIPNDDIYTWARDWINHLSIDETEKENFMEKLADGVSFEDNLKFRGNFILAMLVDMGILSIV